MSDAVGTVHLNISADLTTLEARLKQRLGVLGKEVGQKLGQDLGREATRGIETSMAGVARTAFVPLEQSAKTAGKKISDNLNINVKTDKAKAQLDALAAQKRIVELQVEANTRKAEAKVAEFDAKENQLRIDVDAKVDGAQAKLDALLAQRKTFEIDVEVQTLRAKAQLDSIDNHRKVVFEADAKTDGAKTKLDSLGKSLSSAGGWVSGLQSGLNGMALAATAGVASMGTIIPVAIAASGAVLALGVAAAGVGSAFGVAALAFSGVGTALTAMDAQQSKAGESAAQAATAAISMANAQNSLRSALQGVTDAQHQAGMATEQAARQTADAEKALQAAQQDELQTQRDLNAAREQAVRDLEDIANRATDAALNQRQAALDLTDAQTNYDKVLANPKSTQAQIDRARLQRDQAEQRKKEADEEAKRTAADAAKAKKAGVEGSQAVTQAKGAERAATDKVHAAEQAVIDARKNEAEVARNNAESIAKAEQGVVQAQRGVQAALLATQQVGATTANAVNEAMANLSPAGQHFAKFIFGLKGNLDDLKKSAQTALLPSLESAIKILLPYLPQVKAFVGEVGKAMGDVAIKIARSLTGPEWKAFFSAVRDQAPGDIRKIGDIFVTVGKIIARVFTAAAPYAKPILDGIKNFFDRIDKKATPGKLKSLFDGIMPTLAAVWNVVASIGNIIKSIADAGKGSQGNAADTLNKVASAFNKLATYIDKHPDTVDKMIKLAASLVAIRAANPVIGVIGGVGQALGGFSTFANNAWTWGSKLFAAGGLFGEGGMFVTAMEAVGAVIAGITAPVWIAIGVIALVVGGLIILYFKCQWFHDKVNTIVHAIGQFFLWLWNNAIHPALNAIGAAMKWLYEHVVQPIWTLIWTAIKIAWAIIEVIFGTIKIELKILGMAWGWLYDHVIHPVWNWIADHISTVWNKNIKPILDTVGSYIHDHVAPVFSKAIKVLGTIWDGLMEMFKAPIRFLIQTVLDDGLFAAYNWVAKKFSVKPDDVHVDVPAILQPAKKATGGSIIGPGTGTSDSIPALLSNGEHVWTAQEVRAAGGHQAVEAIRALVLGGGLPRFADGGGVFGWIKNAAGSTWDATKSAGSWAWDKAKDIGGAVKDFVTDPLGMLKRIASAALDHIPGGKSSLLSKAIIGVANKTVSGIADFAKSLFGFGGSGGGGGGGGPVPGGVEHWRSTALQALAMTGQPAAMVGSLLDRMNRESGGNPRAINLWDSNAKAGTPSKGLMQVIDPTFAAYHMAGTSGDIYDPLANIVASIRYAAATYGSLPAAYNRAGGYDSGGWLMPGSTLVHNDTGKPEAVFSPSQWATLEANLVTGLDGGDYSKTTSIDVHSYGDPNAIASAIAAEQSRADLLDAISL